MSFQAFIHDMVQHYGSAPSAITVSQDVYQQIAIDLGLMGTALGREIRYLTPSGEIVITYASRRFNYAEAVNEEVNRGIAAMSRRIDADLYTSPMRYSFQSLTDSVEYESPGLEEQMAETPRRGFRDTDI